MIYPPHHFGQSQLDLTDTALMNPIIETKFRFIKGYENSISW